MKIQQISVSGLLGIINIELLREIVNGKAAISHLKFCRSYRYYLQKIAH